VTLCNRSILVVSTEPWFGPLLSKQYVAQELARQNQVLFLDPPFNPAELARRHWQRTYFRERYHNLRPANLRRFQPWRLPRIATTIWWARLHRPSLRRRYARAGFAPT
jgi:hypothetical protein